MQKGNKRSRESQARDSIPHSSDYIESGNNTEEISHNSDIPGYKGGETIGFHDFMKACIIAWEQYLLGV